MIEEAIAEVEGVHEVAVIGAPDETLGERLCAFVVANTDGALDAPGVRKALRSSLPLYKVPTEINLVSTLPKNESGKILKRELGPGWRPT